MCTLQQEPRNSSQSTTQEGWRYTPCGNKICFRTYIEYAGICPMLTSNGIERTPRMLSSRMLMPRRLDHYARLAYMVKTGRHDHGTMHDDSNIGSTKELCKGDNTTCMAPSDQ